MTKRHKEISVAYTTRIRSGLYYHSFEVRASSQRIQLYKDEISAPFRISLVRLCW